MTFADDQAKAAENRAHRLTDADCHAWGDDAGVEPDGLSAARPLVWLLVAAALVVVCWWISGVLP